jgi:hypothetical protein
MTTRARSLFAMLLLLATSCAERPLTEIVVVVDTRMRIPEQLDTLEIEITPPAGPVSRRLASLSGEEALALPITLSVVHRGGALGPVTVTVNGRLGTDVVVTRQAEVSFALGRTLVVLLPLEAACVGVACAERETCAAGACRDVVLSPSEIGLFDGSVPHLGDGGALCTALPELCNGIDDDCDGRADEGLDTSADPMNCGVCGNACPALAHARPACADGLCGLACETGYGDCDGDTRDGCEQQLNTLSSCAACATECTTSHGAPTCFLGECALDSCAPGWGDCDASAADGCESALNDPLHCGGCGPCSVAGATASCSEGVCGIAMCDAGAADCNGLLSDGCEARIDSLAACGACGRACPSVAHGSGLCTATVCSVGSCDAGYADCDHSAATGCEASLTTMTDCGDCGVPCALAHATEVCAVTGCAIASCDAGWRDCNASPADGCEVSLDTVTNCGTCARVCGAAAPICGVVGTTRNCVTGCSGAQVLCGGTCADLSVSLSHCGACDRACAPAHAAGVCASGACAIAACDPGFGDCNGLASDGCETPLDTLASCGACGATCDLAGAGERCDAGRCVVTACDPGLADCNASATDGCETSILALSDCGACGAVCAPTSATASCATGLCEIVSCNAGHADCDGLAADGCEKTLATLTDCRACGDVCDVPRATESCATGACVMTACDAGWADCNASVADGCERSLLTTSDCGACGAPCAAGPNETASCATGMCLRTCLAAHGDCDGLTADGCEAPLNTAAACGACGVVCSGPTPLCADLGGGTYACDAGCAPTESLCGTACADLASDELNCSGCGIVCAPAAATGVCVAGACRISSCNPGFGDCNGLATDGCERSTRTLTDCATCGTTCGPFANASALCTTGACSFACASPWGNCDAMTGNGCERRLDTVMNCGACGRMCPTVGHSSPSCVASTCTPVCSPDHRDCNGVYSDGCESDIRADDANCGVCGLACALGTRCDHSVCA